MKTRQDQALSIILACLVLLTLLASRHSGILSQFVRLVNYPASRVQSGKTSQNRLTVATKPVADAATEKLAAQLRASQIKARVIKRQINPYQHQILVNVGSRNGVASDMLVVAQGYLVGRVGKVFDQVAWVQLVSDPTFRIGVAIESANFEAILKGANTAILVDRVPSAETVTGRAVSTYGNSAGDIAGVPIGHISDEVGLAGASGLRRYLLDRPVREEFITDMVVFKPVTTT